MTRFLLTVLLSVGCAEPAAPPDSGASSGPAVALAGQITDLLTGAGEPGVRVCSNDPELTCATSDARGSYEVRAPANTETALVVTLEGHQALLVPVQTLGEDTTLRPLSLLPDAIVTAQAAAVGATGDPDLGQVVFSVSNGIPGDGVNVSGVQATLAPDSGVGPFYLGSIGLPDPALDATSTNGGGGWMDVTPGEAALAFETLPGGCVSLFGWGGPTPLRFAVRADHATVLRIECPGAEVPLGGARRQHAE